MATRRLQHLAEQLVTAAPRGVDPARALPTGQEDDLNKLAGDAGVPSLRASAMHHSTENPAVFITVADPKRREPGCSIHE